MNIVIVDNDRAALKNLNRILEQIPGNLTAAFQSPSAAVSYVEYNPVDIVFLEIDAYGFSVYDIVPRLRKYNKRVNIVFISNHEEYALYAFELRSCGFITKPVSKEKIQDELDHPWYPVLNTKTILHNRAREPT